jgi:hypothetical protein
MRHDRDERNDDQAGPDRVKRLARDPKHPAAAPRDEERPCAKQQPHCLQRPAGDRAVRGDDRNVPVAEEEDDEGREQDCGAGGIAQHERPDHEQGADDRDDDDQGRQDVHDVRLGQVRGVQEQNGIGAEEQRVEWDRLTV